MPRQTEKDRDTHNNNDGGEHFPGPFPEPSRIRIESEHQMEVVQEPVRSVYPGHNSDLHTAEDEGAVGGAVVVKDLEDVVAAVSHHAQSHQKHEKEITIIN